MRNHNLSLLLIKIIIILFFFTDTENFVQAVFFTKHSTVKVYNDLGPGTTLRIHCQSVKEDLGVHYLGYKQHFDWSFGRSIFGNTKFWCDVYWEKRQENFQPFDMERSTEELGLRDYELCEPCAWRVTSDGAYRYHNKLNFETWIKFYDW
ncbi:hypothetical protein ACOSQ2_021964 [Xanthoceras sorbifolium]